jgi:cell wall assembly regulator SMI1
MQLGLMSGRLQKLGLDYDLPGPAPEPEIQSAERRLNVSFPNQVRQFYKSYDGLLIKSPHLEMLPVSRLTLTSPDRLHFATVDSQRRLFFDVSHLNVAGQWDVRSEDEYLVTLTMSSFWSNKIWNWLVDKKKIWCEL